MAKGHLGWAQNKLENVTEDRSHDLRNVGNVIDFDDGNGPREYTAEECDLRWLKNGMDRTAKIIAAEEALAAAKVAAQEAGVTMGDQDQSSVFITKSDEGDRLSNGRVFNPEKYPHPPRVLEWASSEATRATWEQEEPDVDEHADTGDIAMGESSDMIAPPLVRQKINQWREVGVKAMSAPVTEAGV